MRRDGWWPTLHDDGAVTWDHADGRQRTDPSPAVLDRYVQRLIEARADPPEEHAFAARGAPAVT